jgi:hypothetical protein
MLSFVRSAVVTLAGSLLVACARPHTALGGFEGRITLHTVEATGAETEFVITAKGDVLRVDMPPSGAKSGDVKERARMRVTKVERASVNDDAFALPADYVKVDPHFDEPSPRSGGSDPPVKGRPR